MPEFSFAPAVRENTPMVVALAGPSGSGKTFTALELAMGLAGDGKIALIDTEGRRGLHYADLKLPSGEPRFRFDHCDFRSPYTPARFLDALKAAEGAGYSVIVTDSFSDEYVGEGGLVDMAAAEKVENTAAKWAKPKAQHKLVIRWLRQSRCHLIFCIRAEEKVKLEKIFNDRKGKEEIVVVPIGWQPVCEKNTMYDMTASFMLHPEDPGAPHPIKLQEQHRPLFPDGQPITRESGERLAAWCAGGAAPQESSPARAAVKRIRDQIAKAAFIEQLNATALFGPSAAEDERLIKAQAGGDAVWADLVDRDAKRRLELAEGVDA